MPKMQVTISTSEGEMPLTGNAEVEQLVLREISRQVQEADLNSNSKR